MAAHCGVAKKNERKQNKKLTRIKSRLSKLENVIICEEPTTILCVYNGGLDNGVSQEELLELLMQYGIVQELIMIPKKPYCFVCYDSCDAATNAKNYLTGFVLREGRDRSQTVTLFLFYTSSVPCSICPSREFPPGLLLLEEFITPETEAKLLASIQSESCDACGTGSTLKHREVKHFGYEFKYDSNSVDPNAPLPEGIPDECLTILQQAVDRKIVRYFPDQLTINTYQPGQGIPTHIDTPCAFEDGIMSLSCGSQVVMDFRHPDGRQLSVLVPARSLLVMTGDCRYIWSHGITPRKSDILPAKGMGLTLKARGVRTSFTFRKLAVTAEAFSVSGLVTRSPIPNCIPRTEQEAVALESLHVHSVYEEIAEHFSHTRHKPWPKIADFLLTKTPGSFLLDVGCGNGKYFGINTELYEMGSDRSGNLSNICGYQGYQVFVADVLAIPVRSASVDVGLCIAVLHHLSTKERRRKAVQELVRILKPGGCVLIYVWAQEQEKDNQKSKYLKSGQRLKQTATGQGVTGRFVADFVNMDEMQNTLGTDSDCLNMDEMQNTLGTDSDISKGLVSSLDKEKSDEAYLLPVHVNRTSFKEQDVLVPWKHSNTNRPGEQTFHRFYHVFRQGELESLCAEVSGCSVQTSYYDQGNWCVVLHKI